MLQVSALDSCNVRTVVSVVPLACLLRAAVSHCPEKRMISTFCDRQGKTGCSGPNLRTGTLSGILYKINRTLQHTITYYTSKFLIIYVVQLGTTSLNASLLNTMVLNNFK